MHLESKICKLSSLGVVMGDMYLFIFLVLFIGISDNFTFFVSIFAYTILFRASCQL